MEDLWCSGSLHKSTKSTHETSLRCSSAQIYIATNFRQFEMMTCPFETPLSLSARDQRLMHNIAQRCISETMSDYEHVLASKSGLPVSTRWKPVKRKQNITVYQDQLVIEEIKRRKRKAKSLGEMNETVRVAEAFSKSVGSGTCPLPADPREVEANEPTELPKMTWMGTVECELDDLMYGIVNQNDEVTRIKASYSGDDIHDSATLASLETATPSDPFHGLQLKWEISNPLSKANPVWHRRDFVYLEATGITKCRSTGQRIGYQILHSLDVRGVPELPGRKLTRGKMTIYQLFRQKSKGTVEVYAKASIDLAGDVASSMTSFATIEAANSVNKAAKCARKRKLNWLLATAETNAVNYGAHQNDSYCSVCSRELRSTFGHKSYFDCQICTNRVCHRCHVRQKLSFVNPDQNSFVVKQKALDLCTRCVHTSTQTNARRVALEERAREDPASMYTYIARRRTPTLQESECAKHIEISRRTTENDMDYPTQKVDFLGRATQVLHRFF
ncbi:uncharacterized protein IUM83_16082 [Phytophthora cinnamomi]|uniref:uncharacterized protein n=1 Tax=Phytophthora cinnamomi TaxID=4785 RepID=UPI00355A587B|nr:hypothetical protein IUM83_16082 [Phytophthora cinnamomi]